MTSRRRAAVWLRAAQRVLDVLSSGDVYTRLSVSRPVGDESFDHHWRGQQEQGADRRARVCVGRFQVGLRSSQKYATWPC